MIIKRNVYSEIIQIFKSKYLNFNNYLKKLK